MSEVSQNIAICISTSNYSKLVQGSPAVSVANGERRHVGAGGPTN